MSDINRADYPFVPKNQKPKELRVGKLPARAFWTTVLFSYDLLCTSLACGVEKGFLQEPPRQYVGIWRDIRLTPKGAFAITLSTSLLGLAMSAFVVVHAK